MDNMAGNDDEDLSEYKKKLKEKLKQKLKKELLEEIYEELQAEDDEDGKDIVKVPIKREESQKPADIKVEEAKENTIIALKVVLKMASHAFKYANKKIPRENWIEVIGLLAGRLDKNDVLQIEDAYPMGHGDAVYAEIKDYKNFVTAFNDLKKKGYFICGWYHSHPTYGCFLSDEDIGTQSRYQRLWERSVALVIDPYKIDGKSFGFKIFRTDLKKGKWFSIPYSFKEHVDPSILPGLLDFIDPIVDGKPLYLEYDDEEDISHIGG